MVEEDSLAIKMAQARLSNHDERQRRRRLVFFFFFAVKLGALIPHYEKYLFYY